MDDADRAGIEIEREEERMRLSIASRPHTWAVVCVECGADLEPHRREFGLCIDCAEARERKAAMMRR